MKEINNVTPKGFGQAVVEYREIAACLVQKKVLEEKAVIDCFGILDDAKIQRYFELGCEVKGPWPGPYQED